MQAATPLLQTFIMEATPPALRARATSLVNLVWNIGWGVSAVMAGTVIERFGYAMPFYLTAALYAIAATTFWMAFRKVPEQGAEVMLSEEAKGRRADGVLSDRSAASPREARPHCFGCGAQIVAGEGRGP